MTALLGHLCFVIVDRIGSRGDTFQRCGSQDSSSFWRLCALVSLPGKLLPEQKQASKEQLQLVRLRPDRSELMVPVRNLSRMPPSLWKTKRARWHRSPLTTMDISALWCHPDIIKFP